MNRPALPTVDESSLPGICSSFGRDRNPSGCLLSCSCVRILPHIHGGSKRTKGSTASPLNFPSNDGAYRLIFHHPRHPLFDLLPVNDGDPLSGRPVTARQSTTLHNSERWKRPFCSLPVPEFENRMDSQDNIGRRFDGLQEFPSNYRRGGRCLFRLLKGIKGNLTWN